MRVARAAGLLSSACLSLVTPACTDPTFVDTRSDAAVDAETEELDAASAGPGELARPDGEAVDDAGRVTEQDATSAGGDAASQSDPAQGSGAEASPVQGSDAAVGSALPDWAVPLVGVYAKRSVNFSYDDAAGWAVNTRNVEDSIVSITQSGDELALSVQLCSYTVALQGQEGRPLYIKNGASTPVMKGRLVLGAANTFSSEPMLQHLGFDPARWNVCDASRRRQKYDEQAWITGSTCQCYASILPSASDDCRVIDGDGDGKAGVTAGFMSPVADVWMVFDYAVTFVDGQIKPDGRIELREQRAQSPACINAAIDGCSFGNNQLCPNVGSTKILRLTEATSCASLNAGAFGPIADNWPSDVDCRAK